MKKRLRPTFFEHLDAAYVPDDVVVAAGWRTLFKQPREKRQGVIDMSITQFVALAVFFIIVACVATAGTAYGVIVIAGEGPRGERGVEGIAGAPGPAGPQGLRGLQGLPGDDAAQAMIKRLAGMFAVQQSSAVQGGARVNFNDEEVGTCVQYVLTGVPGVDACPGFTSQ